MGSRTMTDRDDVPPKSQPRPVPRTNSSNNSNARSPVAGSGPRNTSTARLASPVPSSAGVGTPAVRQLPTPSQVQAGAQTPLAGADPGTSLPGPGKSALAAALQGAYGSSPPRFGTPPLRPHSPPTAGALLRGLEQQSNYGSFDTQPTQGHRQAAQLGPIEDAEIVKRHLVQPSDTDLAEEPSRSGRNSFSTYVRGNRSTNLRTSNAQGLDDEEFSSLQLQGGDMTREVYKWAEDADAQSQSGGRGQRSKSFYVPRPPPESDVLDINAIKVPGGFRRNYLRRAAQSPSPTRHARFASIDGEEDLHEARQQTKLFTNNFIEFLTLYGHFAGEELEDDDEDLEPDGYFDADRYDDAGDEDDDDREPGEGSALLTPRTPGGRRRILRAKGETGQNTAWGAALLLLKSFVGTGVLFMPRAYLNGGMLFSNVVLLGVASLSYYCFILLVNTRLKIEGSFGDIGGILYGRSMRFLILTSIVLSQIGFVSAYIVFTSENLQAFILAVSQCRTWIDIKFMVLMQLIVFLPLSLIRDISKLGVTALVADFFILLGLVYLYYYDIFTIVSNHGIADIHQFNPKDWTLFIGTAIFTFEGVGLIIPIQSSMKKPSEFPPVLAIVMVVITAVFISMGAISYAAFGSSTKTVVLLNLPQDDKFVNAVQFLYSLAILLSTPLQLFPAIRILETEIFSRSGKYNAYIKWEKNVFRFCLVMLCAAIAWGGAGDLDKFVALVGSFACVPLVYVYPVSILTVSHGSSLIVLHSHSFILEQLHEVAGKEVEISLSVFLE